MPSAFQRVVFQCLVRDALDWTNVDWVTLFKSWTDGVYTQTLCMWGEKIYWDMLNSSIHPSSSRRGYFVPFCCYIGHEGSSS